MSRVQQILQKKHLRKEKLNSSLNTIVDQLKSLDVRKIILFGSLANDNVDVDSDLDLLVIMPSTKDGKDWMKLIYQKIHRTISSDFLVYNEQEFDEKLSSSSFLKVISNSGTIIYEKTSY